MDVTFDIPPIGPRNGKIWGRTQLVFARNDTEAHVIEVERGGYCSRHSHRAKWNRFFVLSGELIVRVYGDDNFLDETTLTAGQVHDVPPGVRHEFEAAKDTLAVEFYWSPLSPSDIDRYETRGGMKSRSAETDG